MFGLKGKDKILNVTLKENERLVRENNSLREKINNIEDCLGEYSSLVDELKEYRDAYKKQLKIIKDLENSYKTELDKLVK